MKPRKINLDRKFYFETEIVHKGLNIIFCKAINRRGEFVWVEKNFFLEKPDEEFYLIILPRLDDPHVETMFAWSFNFFRNRQDFYSQYTFVRKVKKHESAQA